MALKGAVVFNLFSSICFFFNHVTCQTGTDAKDLRTQLFTTNGYDYRVRPQDTQSVAIDVQMNFYLLNINGLNEVTETLKTTGYLWIVWQDDFLVWDPVDYGGIQYQHWPQGDVWKPDVALKNSYKDYKELGVSSLRVYVDNSGGVQWYPFQVFESTCSIDITNYPFDTQKCSLTFGAWSYTKNEVNIQSGSKGIILDEYVNSSTWDLVNVNWKVENDEDGDAEISFILTIKRKPLNAIMTLILPVIMLSILDLFVFMLPSSGGEKAGYAITVFLAFAVFLTIIADSLPENSDKMAYFSIYLLMQTIQSTLITIIALMLIRLSSFGEDNGIPRVLLFVTRLMKRRTCRRRQTDNQVEPLPKTIKTVDTAKRVNDTATKEGLDNDAVDNDEETETERITWEQVANALDWLLFIVFALTLTVSTIYCFVTAANG